MTSLVQSKQVMLAPGQVVQSGRVSFVPEHEVTEEGVALAHSKVVQKGLGEMTGIFQEAGEACKHLYNLQGGQVV